MRLKRAVAAVGAAGGLLLGGAVVTAGSATAVEDTAVDTCGTSGVGTRTGTGSCTVFPKEWRLGIRCTSGEYQWSAWYSYTTTARLTCVSGTVTNVWTDTR